MLMELMAADINVTNNSLFESVNKSRMAAPVVQRTPVTTFTPEQKAESKESYKLPVIISSIIGTLIPMLILQKHQKAKNLLKVNFGGLKEALLIGLGSVTGGLVGGFYTTDKKEERKNIIKESIFQIINIAVPASLVAGAIELSNKIFVHGKPAETIKKLAKYCNISKGLGAAAGIWGGMLLASSIANKINNTIYQQQPPEKRSFSPKDLIAQIDEIVLAMIFCKFEFLKGLHVDKLLPVLYSICGMEAGNHKK